MSVASVRPSPDVPFPALPGSPGERADENPAAVYLAALADGPSRYGMRSTLDRIAALAGFPDATAVPWQEFRLQHVSAVRAVAAATFLGPHDRQQVSFGAQGRPEGELAAWPDRHGRLHARHRRAACPGELAAEWPHAGFRGSGAAVRGLRERRLSRGKAGRRRVFAALRRRFAAGGGGRAATRGLRPKRWRAVGPRQGKPAAHRLCEQRRETRHRCMGPRRHAGTAALLRRQGRPHRPRSRRRR